MLKNSLIALLLHYIVILNWQDIQEEKFLSSLRVRKNGAPFFYIYGGLHYKFNERTPP